MKKEAIKVRDLRNGDWYWSNKLVLDHPYLTSSTKVVYHALAYFADNDSQKAYPSLTKICQLTNLKRPTVIKAVRQLEEYHFIKVEKEQGRLSKYTLLKLTDSRPVKKVDHSVPGFLPGSGWLKKG